MVELDAKNMMSKYELVVTIKHARLMRIRYWLAGLIMILATYLCNLENYELVEAGADSFCDCGACGNGCAYTEPYGFVPEAGCPIHD